MVAPLDVRERLQPTGTNEEAPGYPEAFSSGPPRDRTEDPLIKSQLLYQLS
jgi:hypothetical protein